MTKYQICKSCDEQFQFPAYRECEHSVTHWEAPLESGSRQGSGYSRKIFQPSCPFCGMPLYQGDTREEYDHEGKYQSLTSKVKIE